MIFAVQMSLKRKQFDSDATSKINNICKEAPKKLGLLQHVSIIQFDQCCASFVHTRRILGCIWLQDPHKLETHVCLLVFLFYYMLIALVSH